MGILSTDSSQTPFFLTRICVRISGFFYRRTRWCDVTPFWQGAVIEDYYRRSTVTCLFPLNHLLWLIVSVYRRIRHAPVDEVRSQMYRDILKEIGE